MLLLSYELYFKSPMAITDTYAEGVKNLSEEKKRTIYCPCANTLQSLSQQNDTQTESMMVLKIGSQHENVK